MLKLRVTIVLFAAPLLVACGSEQHLQPRFSVNDLRVDLTAEGRRDSSAAPTVVDRSIGERGTNGAPASGGGTGVGRVGLHDATMTRSCSRGVR